jgi:hypothetical protein
VEPVLPTLRRKHPGGEGRVKTEQTCVADGCEEDSVVGLSGRYLCLDHFAVEHKPPAKPATEEVTHG